jgi:hypothetical protein
MTRRFKICLWLASLLVAAVFLPVAETGHASPSI